MPDLFLADALLILAAYLAGSIATAVIVCRLLGLVDPRTVGSGNPGATNVLRHGNRPAAVLTLIGDVLKGLLPVLVARLLEVSPEILAGTALATFLGHLFPVFFGFKGGKGVATALGAMLGMAWPVALACLVTWLLAAAVLRYSSLSAILAAALAPVYTLMFTPQPSYVTVMVVISTLLIWRHRSNIRKLMDGTEDRIGGRDRTKGTHLDH